MHRTTRTSSGAARSQSIPGDEEWLAGRRAHRAEVNYGIVWRLCNASRRE